MENGVYLETSIVNLKPRVLDFLTKLVEKAKELKEYAVSFKKKELAEITGKDIRTTSRYLKELEERRIITTKGVRGRAGGTVIMFNADLIRFETSDKAFINSEKPISIDDIVEQKLPKKKKEKKEATRNRRTKQEMIIAKALEGKKQSEIDMLNDELDKLHGIPNWAWFQSTNDPVGNYKTYLLSRLYNRYAALFVDQNNVDIEQGRAGGNYLKRVTDDYDVLPARFYGSSRWYQFEKFRIFCDENGIEPAKYLSAQFNRSVFEASNKNMDKKKLPFTNALTSETAYEVYLQYVGYNMNSTTYRVYHQIPAKFMDDFVIRAIEEAYESAEEQKGLLQFSSTIRDFFEGDGFGAKEEALLNFYDMTVENMRKQGVSRKSQTVIKKFIMLQSLIQSYGVSGLPEYVILGSEMTHVLLASINHLTKDRKAARKIKERALGVLAYPKAKSEEQLKQGAVLYNRMVTLYETPRVLRLIMERKGLDLTLAGLNAAFKEYGKDKIPLDDYSMLDTDKVMTFMRQGQHVEEPEINYEDIVDKHGWKLEQSLANEDSLENLLHNL